jgi:hypothetical protein
LRAIQRLDLALLIAAEVGVTAMPRHFVFPPQAGLGELIENLDLDKEGLMELEHGESSALLYYTPILMRAVRAAFKRNRYGERFARITWSDLWWRQLFKAPFSSWKVGGLELNDYVGYFNPAFHFTKRELTGVAKSNKTHRRLRECAIPEFAVTPEGLEARSDKLLYPGYRAEETFRKMLVAVDAAFLLREISDLEWRKLSNSARLWRERVRDIIRGEFFLPRSHFKAMEGRSGRGGLRGVLGVLSVGSRRGLEDSHSRAARWRRSREIKRCGRGSVSSSST